MRRTGTAGRTSARQAEVLRCGEERSHGAALVVRNVVPVLVLQVQKFWVGLGALGHVGLSDVVFQLWRKYWWRAGRRIRRRHRPCRRPLHRRLSPLHRHRSHRRPLGLRSPHIICRRLGAGVDVGQLGGGCAEATRDGWLDRSGPARYGQGLRQRASRPRCLHQGAMSTREAIRVPGTVLASCANTCSEHACLVHDVQLNGGSVPRAHA